MNHWKENWKAFCSKHHALTGTSSVKIRHREDGQKEIAAAETAGELSIMVQSAHVALPSKQKRVHKGQHILVTTYPNS